MFYGIFLVVVGVISVLLLVCFQTDEFNIGYIKLVICKILLSIISVVAGLGGFIYCLQHLAWIPNEIIRWVMMLISSISLVTLGMATLTVAPQIKRTFKGFAMSFQGTLSIITVGKGICQIVISIMF